MLLLAHSINFIRGLGHMDILVARGEWRGLGLRKTSNWQLKTGNWSWETETRTRRSVFARDT